MTVRSQCSMKHRIYAWNSIHTLGWTRLHILFSSSSRSRAMLLEVIFARSCQSIKLRYFRTLDSRKGILTSTMSLVWGSSLPQASTELGTEISAGNDGITLPQHPLSLEDLHAKCESSSHVCGLTYDDDNTMMISTRITTMNRTIVIFYKCIFTMNNSRKW